MVLAVWHRSSPRITHVCEFCIFQIADLGHGVCRKSPKFSSRIEQFLILKELDVSGNGICDVGAKLLFEALEFNVVLTDLKIGTNQIRDESN